MYYYNFDYNIICTILSSIVTLLISFVLGRYIICLIYGRGINSSPTHPPKVPIGPNQNSKLVHYTSRGRLHTCSNSPIVRHHNVPTQHIFLIQTLKACFILPVNVKQMLTSQMRGEYFFKYCCERRVVMSNWLRSCMKYEPGFTLTLP